MRPGKEGKRSERDPAGITNPARSIPGLSYIGLEISLSLSSRPPCRPLRRSCRKTREERVAKGHERVRGLAARVTLPVISLRGERECVESRSVGGRVSGDENPKEKGRCFERRR